MKKRGQIDQIYVYIFALIVAGLIIGFGYYAITNVLKLGKSVETVKFNTEFEKQINLYYDFAPGTNTNIKIPVPSNIQAICFVVDPDGDIEYSDVKETAEYLTDMNVFFSTTKEGTTADPIKVAKFKPSPDPLCINTLRGVLDIDLTTMGKYVQVSAHS